MKRRKIVLGFGIFLVVAFVWTHSRLALEREKSLRLEKEYAGLLDVLSGANIGSHAVSSEDVLGQVNKIIHELGLKNQTVQIASKARQCDVVIEDLSQEALLSFFQSLREVETIAFKHIDISKNSKDLIRLTLTIHIR